MESRDIICPVDSRQYLFLPRVPSSPESRINSIYGLTKNLRRKSKPFEEPGREHKRWHHRPDLFHNNFASSSLSKSCIKGVPRMGREICINSDVDQMIDHVWSIDHQMINLYLNFDRSMKIDQLISGRSKKAKKPRKSIRNSVKLCKFIKITDKPIWWLFFFLHQIHR